MELAGSLLALQHGQLPGTLNHDRARPGLPGRGASGAPRPVTQAVRREGRRTPTWASVRRSSAEVGQ